MHILCRLNKHRWQWQDAEHTNVHCSRCHKPLPRLRPGQSAYVHGHLIARYIVENDIVYELVKRSK